MYESVSSTPARSVAAACPSFMPSSFSATAAAFSLAAWRSSWAWIALSIAATSLIFPLGTTVNTLR